MSPSSTEKGRGEECLPRLTREQAAIIGAVTGYTAGPFSDIHEYAERKLGRPIWTTEFADLGLRNELRAAAKEDFLAICARATGESSK
jgi:hypothetical protein